MISCCYLGDSLRHGRVGLQVGVNETTGNWWSRMRRIKPDFAERWESEQRDGRKPTAGILKKVSWPEVYDNLPFSNLQERKKEWAFVLVRI